MDTFQLSIPWKFLGPFKIFYSPFNGLEFLFCYASNSDKKQKPSKKKGTPFFLP